MTTLQDETTDPVANWELALDEDVQNAVVRAVTRVNSVLPDFTVADDLGQNALIWVATHATQVQGYKDRGELDLLAYRIYSRLIDQLRPELRRQEKIIPLHRLVEGE